MANTIEQLDSESGGCPPAGGTGAAPAPRFKRTFSAHRHPPSAIEQTSTISYPSQLPPFTTMSESKLHVLQHPVVNARLSKLRQTTTTGKEFREGIHDISLILGVEASRDLEEETFNGQTPIGPFTGSVIKPKVGLTPVLRAGLGMTDALLNLFPEARVYHLGIFREKVSLHPVEYYSKLPENPNVDQVFLLDPLIATGGTACAALAMLLDWGIPVNNIKLLCVLASQDGLRHVQAQYPGVETWVATIDPHLTPDGLISPGLGDTGDRLYNTLKSEAL